MMKKLVSILGIEVYEKQTGSSVSISELVKELVTDYLEDSYVDYASDSYRRKIYLWR